MNQLPFAKRVAILSALVEGNSLRSTSRMIGVSINTVTKLLIDTGLVCARYQHDVMRNLPCQRLQLDEIWSFCGMKERNVPAEHRGEYGIGDVWTWTAICAETKLVPCWLVGLRDYPHAKAFVEDLATRLSGRVQLTSDGLKVYLRVISEVFGEEIDFGTLIKIYGVDPLDDRRYSPSVCLDCIKEKVIGEPDKKHIST